MRADGRRAQATHRINRRGTGASIAAVTTADIIRCLANKAVAVWSARAHQRDRLICLPHRAGDPAAGRL